MAAQRSRARCGMIRRRAVVAARKTGCQIAAPTRECRSEPLEATPESRRFQANFINGILLFKSKRATLTRRAEGHPVDCVWKTCPVGRLQRLRAL